MKHRLIAAFASLSLVTISLGFAGLAGLAGCALLPKPIEKPKASVRGVAVHSVSFTGLSGEVALDVFNPNAFSVPLRRVDWQLAIAGAGAVSGQFDLSEHVPARDTAPVIVALTVDALAAANVASRLSAGERGYRLQGTMYFATRLGEISVTFVSEGQLDTALGVLGDAAAGAGVLGAARSLID